MIVNWAHPQLAPRIINLRLVNQTRSAGESVTGFEQVNFSVTQRWAFSLEFNNLKRQTILPYRAMVASLEGRANALRVPVFDRQFWPSDELIGLVSSTHSDGSDFDDGGDYQTSDVSGVVVSGLKGAKEITVPLGDLGELLQAGLYFGIADETYIATSVTYSGSTATVGFQPGLRQDHTDAQFRFRPRLIMRLASDEVGELPLERGIIGAPSLELVEILPDELTLLEAGG